MASLRTGQYAVAGIVLFLAGVSYAATVKQTPGQDEKKLTFAKDVKPIIQKNCYRCHSGDHPAAGRDLKDKDAFVPTPADKITDEKPGFVDAGHPDKSILVWVITKTHNKPQMPPGGDDHKLSDDDVKTIQTWIKQGAKPGEDKDNP
jgi:cytochrome c5